MDNIEQEEFMKKNSLKDKQKKKLNLEVMNFQTLLLNLKNFILKIPPQTHKISLMNKILKTI